MASRFFVVPARSVMCTVGRSLRFASSHNTSKRARKSVARLSRTGCSVFKIMAVKVSQYPASNDTKH